MFSFFKKKPPAPAAEPLGASGSEPAVLPAPTAASVVAPSPHATPQPAPAPPLAQAPAPAAATGAAGWLARLRQVAPGWTGAPVAEPAPAAERIEVPPAPPPPSPSHAARAPTHDAVPRRAEPPPPTVVAEPAARDAELDLEQATDRVRWMDKLRSGLRKTGSSLAQVFTGAQIGEALYEELETALLMADAGVKATEFLLADLRRRVKDSYASRPDAVKMLLGDVLTDLLSPLEGALGIGRHTPTVIMVVGVNGAGKTTSIGKLTRHLAGSRQKVLLAAADTFRAAAREQLAVWAGRNQVEIVSQEGGDPAAVTYDAVVAGTARGCDVVIADTAGRLTTQVHLMEELKKIRRVIGKAMDGAPHEVLLVVDGNTGQNALSQVQLFDEALALTGLIITKLDGTAKGGVLAAIALWSRTRAEPVPVYFIGVGEQLEDLQTFDAREFAQALLV